jgi:hypothetical protein
MFIVVSPTVTVRARTSKYSVSSGVEANAAFDRRLGEEPCGKLLAKDMKRKKIVRY